MITYQRGNIFDSTAEAIVNTVNTVGVMGAVLRSIVTVLDAVRKQKEEQASA